jgi:alpha-D-ribose 1-methylphosphonate 5-triphosphate synthase subunit PhnG
MTVEAPATATAERRHWMGVLAKAQPAEIAAAHAALGPRPAHRFARPPETGLALLRGRIGGRGAAFNFGEATMTRCVVELADEGPMGFGYVMGRDAAHAERAALFDALLQRGDEAAARQIEHLAEAQAARRRLQAAQTASSKVDFLTMVRE